MTTRPSDPDYYSNCVHCGLCLPKCPTYALLGDENDSPRGRIYMMQAVDKGRISPSPRVQRHLDQCLDCRACETECPSGVPYGQLIENYRSRGDGDHHRIKNWPEHIIDWVLFNVLPFPDRTRWLMRLATWSQALGLPAVLSKTRLGQRYAAGLMFAKLLERRPADLVDLPEYEPPAGGTVKRSAALFKGCVAESLLGGTNRATHRVLRKGGCAVHCPPGQGCCGAIHYHGGRRREAVAFAKANIDAFSGLLGEVEAVVVNAAGCGLMLKEYARLLADDGTYADSAARFSDKVQDISVFLVQQALQPPGSGAPVRVTYHEACHLRHGQNITDEPRMLLRSIPGVELVEMSEPDWCCGAAGAYSLTQPELAARLARRKLHHIDETRSQVVAVGNVGCILHLRQHAALTDRDVQFVHPVDLLDAAYACGP